MNLSCCNLTTIFFPFAFNTMKININLHKLCYMNEPDSTYLRHPPEPLGAHGNIKGASRVRAFIIGQHVKTLKSSVRFV